VQGAQAGKDSAGYLVYRDHGHQFDKIDALRKMSADRFHQAYLVRLWPIHRNGELL
jgi:hypothetical protein